MANKKGPNWERECSRLISLWWSNGKRDDLVWRTSGSGNRHTARMKKKKNTYNQAGDLCATDPCIQPLFDLFLIECKVGYTKKTPVNSLDVLHIADRTGKTNPLLIKWWLKASKECADAKRYSSFIIFKRTNMIPCIAMSHSVYETLATWNGGGPSNQIMFTHDSIISMIRIFTLSDFFEWCSPRVVMEINNLRR